MAISKSKVLLDDAETLLTAIRGGVLVHLQDGVYPEHLKIPVNLAGSLTECVAKIGDEAIAASAETLEAWLMLLASETGAISHTRTRSLLDQISELEVGLIALKTNANASVLDVGDFVDESFRTLSAARSAEVPTAEPLEGFDVDSEMLEVFREEAATLLLNIRTNLETLSDRPTDSRALWEVKRNAHTLKGAAGVAGQTRLSSLAHRAEDLLASFAESDPHSNVGIFDLVRTAAELMTSLADGSATGDVDRQIVSLERQFAAAMQTTSRRPATNSKISKSGVGEAIEPPVAKTAEASSRKGRIFRVSLERLNELVTIVKGLKATRHEFEQHIEELEKQLQEADSNKLRLQAAVGKLENVGPHRRTYETDRSYAEFDQVKYEVAETARDASVINVSLDSVKNSLHELYEHQQRLIVNVQERLMRLRNVEFGTIATRLQRTVRVTCDEEGKRADVVIEAGSLEVDTQVIDLLIEPLLHLLKNAVVHGIEPPDTRRMLGKPETGKITIGVRDDGSNVVMSVTDDGRGIAHQALVDKAITSGRITRDEADRMTVGQVQDLIFLPGFTTAEKLSLNAGRGVGMNIVRESLAAAGGSLTIDTRPQKGTTFTVRIPNPFALIHADEAETLGLAQDEDRDVLKILIVDDSPSVRLMTGRTIRAAGWNTELARNGIDALNKLTSMSEMPNMILSDIEMPIMGGFEFLAALRAEPAFRDIPVVVVSSRTGAEDRKQALAAGALDYVTKPYDDRQLIELIDRLALRPELAIEG